MKVAIGCDHGGFNLKPILKDYLEKKGIEYKDFGCYEDKSTDYNEYALAVAESVAKGECDKGILICGTGIGISLAANKVKGIRAAVCSEPYSAKLSRAHNNANIIAFGSRVVGSSLAEMIVEEFLTAEYEGGRHRKRIDMISEIENGEEIC